MKTLADYIMAVQIEEGTDLHAQAEAHLSKANDADAKGDNYGYHMHMTNHHEALSQWHDSKGRGGLAAKHEDLAAHHEDKAQDALDAEASAMRSMRDRTRQAVSKRRIKENADSIEEGLKQKLGAVALAGSMAMGANARVVPGQDAPGVNRLTGKPNIAQVASHDSDSTETEKPSLKGFSTSYLQKAADPNRSGRFMISAEHAKAELASRESSQQKRTQDVKEAYGGLRGNVGDRSKREFKHRELEHELGHEVNPRASFNRPSSSDVPHAVHIDGKKWKTFGSQSHATNVARKIPGATVHKEEYTVEGMNDWALKDKPKAKSIPQTSGMNSYAMKGDVHNKAYDFPPTHYDKDGKDMYGRKKPEAK